MPVEIIRRFIRKHPIERFIFGTDSPWKDQGKELDYLLSLPFLTDAEKEKIAGANAARMLLIPLSE
jgi:predicted TIM-barrel fold metal-dependent hydrolase